MCLHLHREKLHQRKTELYRPNFNPLWRRRKGAYLSDRRREEMKH